MSTINDVAKVAKVSTATVSRVINKSSKVSSETIVLVEAAIVNVQYKVRGNQRLSINQSLDTIGLIVSRFNSPFYGLLSQGVEKVAKQQGKKMIVVSSHYDAYDEENAIKLMLSKGCQNIVIHSQIMSDQALIQYAKQYPGLVIINRRVATIEEQCVWLDNIEGTYQATKYLIEQGHQRIAFLSCDIEVDDKFFRFEGYRRALDEAGIEFNPDLIEEVPFGEQGGALAATNFLNKGLPMTALVAFNDYFAAAAIQVFKEHGVLIPEQLSVVGFDDVLPQCYFTPKLTTIRNPIESMAISAARISLEGKNSVVSRVFHPLLIKRESVMPPRH